MYRSSTKPLPNAGIFVLAFLPRVLYLLTARPVFESQYWTLSDSLLANGQLGFDGVKTTAFEPAYPIFLAAARILVGSRMLAVQMVQCAVAALGAMFLYRLAAALTGRWRVGLVAALLYAVFPLLIRHSADRTDAALMTMFVAAFVSEFVTAETPMRSAAAGVWLGLTVLTRMMALPLLPLAGAIEWWKGGWRAAGALTLSALAVIAPYAVRNYALNGAVLPTRSGINLFISNSEYTANVFPDYGPDILEDYAASVADAHGLPAGPPSPAVERAYDVLWTRYALQEMRRHPWRIAALKARNVLYFFSPRLVPYHEQTAATTIHLGDNGTFTVQNSPPRRAVDQIVYAMSYTPVLALAVAGVWLRRRDLRRDAILWCVVVTFVAAHAIYFPTTRYRVPMESVLLFYAAVTIERWL